MTAHRLAADLQRVARASEVIVPDHREYDSRRAVWNAMIDRRPGAIVRARSVEDVRSVIRVAAEHGALLAVRGGGHSIPGLSTCNGGIVLDLSLLRRVDVDAMARTVRVDGGALLADLDAAGAPYGLVTPAGVVSHTGVGGLTLGGGMGWLSRRFGMTVDSLLSAEVVTADGRLVHASVEEEPDLFWAIRGGGGNFGVVSSFHFRMHDLASVVVGIWRYPLAQAASMLAGWGQLAPTLPRELSLCLTLLRDTLSVTACWSGAASAAEAAFSPCHKLGQPREHSVTATRFVDLQRRDDEELPWGRRYFVKGGYFARLDQPLIEDMLEAAAAIPNDATLIYLVQLGGAVADVADEQTAFTGRSAEFFWLVEAVWDDAQDDERYVAWARTGAGRLSAHSTAGNYVNEQSEVTREVVVTAYGPTKYQRLG